MDLGAESGRVLRGTFDGEKISLEECARFPTGLSTLHGQDHWDVVRIFESIIEGLKEAAKLGNADGIGVDTWGVDFALLDEKDRFLGFPYAYRDSRTDGMLHRMSELVPDAYLYQRTGIAFMQFNTAYQLLSMQESKDPLLPLAKTLLFMPDVFHFLLSGEKVSEFSHASTSQMLNVETRSWDEEVLKVLELDSKILCDPVQPGTVIGKLTDEVQGKTGLDDVPVIAVACHDTASAIAAIPMTDDRCCYISSGTWCLMGVENRQATVTQEAMDLNFTNEGGVDGTYRFLKNIMGLWLIQRLKGELAEDLDYGTLTEEAAKSTPFRTLVDANDASFFSPKSMADSFRSFAEKSKQPTPETVGQYVRCATESLALEVRLTLDGLRKTVSRPMEKIHMTGGGVKNELLCQMITNATGLPLVGGPIEATGIGNIMMQAIASGHIGSVAEGREVVARSFEMVSFQPGERQGWDEAYERYKKLKG